MRASAFVARAFALFVLCVPLALAGCAGASSTSDPLVPGAPPAGGSSNTPAAASIYAFEPTRLEVIPASANGDVTPSAVFTYSGPGGVCIFGAMDAALNAYVACPTINGQPGSVEIFSTTSGPHPTVRSIVGPHTGIQFATGVAIGGPNGDIYVLQEAGLSGHNATEILVFDKNASGDTAPKRQITVAEDTEIPPCAAQFAFDIVVDSSGDAYVTIQPGGGIFINEYAPDAQGRATPIASIVRQDFQMFGLALDRFGNIYTTGNGTVLEYAAGSTGAATPIRVIGGPHTGFSGLRSVTVDASGNIFVGGEEGVRGKIWVFSGSATGDATPIRTISGPDVLPNVPHSLVVQ